MKRQVLTSSGGLRRYTGSTMIEAMISGMCTVLAGAMVLGFIRVTMVANTLSADQTAADFSARRPLDNLADCIRKAQAYGSGSATLSAATATSITIYNNMSGNTSKYYLNTSVTPYQLCSTIGGTTQVIANGVQNILFTYYLATGYTPAQGSCWVTTANPNAPTSTEMPNVVAVRITISVLIDGSTRYYTTPIRLRNASRVVSGH